MWFKQDGSLPLNRPFLTTAWRILEELFFCGSDSAHTMCERLRQIPFVVARPVLRLCCHGYTVKLQHLSPWSLNDSIDILDEGHCSHSEKIWQTRPQIREPAAGTSSRNSLLHRSSLSPFIVIHTHSPFTYKSSSFIFQQPLTPPPPFPEVHLSAPSRSALLFLEPTPPPSPPHPSTRIEGVGKVGALASS